ncbi:MAG: helix-turn-helix transcriptional regulator, partial [Acetobacter sp.]
MEKNKIIEEIYSTIDNKSHWDTALVHIARYCMGHSGGGAALVPLDDGVSLWRHGSNPDPQAEYLYYTYWKNKTPLATHVPQTLDRDFIYIDDSFLSDSIVDNHPFYQEYLKIFGVRRVSNVIFKTFRNERFMVSLQTPVEASVTELSRIRKNITTIIPHISRSLNLGMKFHQTDAMKASFEEFIYNIPYAVAFLDAHDRVVFCNEKMQEMEKEGVFILGGKIKIPFQTSGADFENISAIYKLDNTKAINFFGKNGNLFIARIFELRKSIAHAAKFIIFN